MTLSRVVGWAASLQLNVGTVQSWEQEGGIELLMSHSTPSWRSSSCLETGSHQEEHQSILCLLWPFCRVPERGKRLLLPTPSQKKSQGEQGLSIWRLSKQEEPRSRRLARRKYDTSTHFQQTREEFINSSHTHVDLSEQQVLNSRVTLSVPFLVYEFHTLSKHFSFLIPTNTFQRLHQVLLLEKIKAFLQPSPWK